MTPKERLEQEVSSTATRERTPMTSWTSDLTPPPYATPDIPLRIEGVIPPEPRPAAGTYDVRLRLSRPLTRFEVRALQPGRAVHDRRGLHPDVVRHDS